MTPLSRENIRLIGQLSSLGLAFVLALVFGFGGGYLLDQWAGTAPLFTFVGFLMGLAAAILNVYRVMQVASASSAPRSDPTQRR